MTQTRQALSPSESRFAGRAGNFKRPEPETIKTIEWNNATGRYETIEETAASAKAPRYVGDVRFTIHSHAFAPDLKAENGPEQKSKP